MDITLFEQALLSGNYASAEDVDRARTYAKGNSRLFLSYFFKNELLTRDLLGQALAEYGKSTYFDLNSHMPSRETVLRIPGILAKKERVILALEEDTKVLVVTDTIPVALPSTVRELFPEKEVQVAYALSEDVEHALEYYHEKLQARFAKIIQEEKRVAPEIFGQIMNDAIVLRASDIHFDPQEQEVVVRFRIDGVLQDVGSIPKAHYENVINRVKIEARLRIDERNKTQDGAIRFLREGVPTDIRVSLAPTLFGEKLVLRVLGEYLKDLTLSELGLSPEYQKVLKGLAERPYGMILTVGPTGSGKTTTLYALLKLINDPSVNITTIEDPVEYRMPRINQIQVNPATDVTFSKGLRSIVRQDPDVILVGEIRDLETAEIAANASLTGHLLLSTFHANDASTVIPRLINMKVEPFLLASTLMAIIAQRLVRTICTECRVSYEVRTKELVGEHPYLSPYVKGVSTTLYRGKGCTQCNFLGYKGRAGIFEIIQVSPTIQNLALTQPTSGAIAKMARKEGSKTLFEDGLGKVLNGTTTLDELLRTVLPYEQGE